MDLDIYIPPTGGAFMAAAAIWWLASLLVFAISAAVVRRVGGRPAPRVIARMAEGLVVAFNSLLGVSLLVPHNHGCIRWYLDGPTSMNHPLEVALGFAICGVTLVGHLQIWRRAVLDLPAFPRPSL